MLSPTKSASLEERGEEEIGSPDMKDVDRVWGTGIFDKGNLYAEDEGVDLLEESKEHSKSVTSTFKRAIDDVPEVEDVTASVVDAATYRQEIQVRRGTPSAQLQRGGNERH